MVYKIKREYVNGVVDEVVDCECSSLDEIEERFDMFCLFSCMSKEPKKFTLLDENGSVLKEECFGESYYQSKINELIGVRE